MAELENVIKGLEDIQKHLDTGYSFAISWQSELIRDALELLKVYKEKIESESEKTTLIDEALEVGRCVLRRGIYLGSDKQWIRVSMTTKEAEKIFGTLRQMKNKQS